MMDTNKFLALALAVWVPACDSTDAGVSLDDPGVIAAPAELVTATDLDTLQLFDELKDLEVGEAVDGRLELGDLGSTPVLFERTALVPDGFTAHQIDDRGRVSVVPVAARSFRATSEAAKLQMDFIIDPNRIEGVLDRGSEMYVLSMLSEPGPDSVGATIGVFRAPVGETDREEDAMCGADEPIDALETFTSAVEDLPGSQGAPRGATCWKLLVRSHADYEFYKGVGKSDVNTAVWQVLGSLVAASTKFSVINLDLVLPQDGGVTVLTAPQHSLYYPKSSDLEALLTQLREFWNFFLPTVDRDLVVLFTGKDVYYKGDYGFGGVAYLSAICKDLSRSYAVVENRLGWTYSVVLTAHEIAHTLGADHTDSGIMKAGSGKTSEFNLVSREQMNQHIWFNHACMPNTTCKVE